MSNPKESERRPEIFAVRLAMTCAMVMAFSFPAMAQQGVPQELIGYPSLVLYNGKVLTADDQFSIEEAVAIRDGKLLAVGQANRILKMAGPNTRKIDLKGKTVVPGFIDTHQHLPLYATQSIYMERDDIRWEGNFNPGGPWIHWESPEHILRNVRKAVAVTPPGEWVMIYGESETRHVAWALKRAQLDAAAPSNPVAIAMAAGSINAVNTLALTRVPKGMEGYPEGDAAQIEGQAAAFLLDEILWDVPLEKLMDALKKRMRDYNAASGLTTIGTRVYATELTALRELWKRGELTVRWRLGVDFVSDYATNPELALKRQGNISDIGDDWFIISGNGGGAGDSSGQSGGAWTWEPKLRVDIPGMEVQYGPFGPRGFEDRWQGKERLTALTRFGWSIANTHSVGDRSTSEFLAAYEEAKQKGYIVKSSAQRLTIDHLLMVRPQDIPKFKELGVIPSISPWFLFMPPNPELLVHQYGEERVNKMMPAKSYIKAGIRPTAEADVDARPYRDPLWNIEKFVTRKDDLGRVWNLDEKVTRKEALWMYTNWNAYQRGDEKKLGTLEAGKLADLVVLDGDYLTVPEDEISDIPVVMTVVGGNVVYEDPTGF